MTKTKKLVISICAGLVIILIGITVALLIGGKKNPDNTLSVIPTDVSSVPTSSEAVSSDFEVPEIASSMTVSSKAESKTTELTVKGSPDGTSSAPPPASSAPPKKTSSTQTKPKTNKPTGDGDVYDERTGTYPKLGDTMKHPIANVNMTWVASLPSTGLPGWLAETDGGSGGGIATDPGIPIDENGKIIYDPNYDIGAD